MRPIFDVVAVGNNCYTINERDRTVALVSSPGYINWLLPSPANDGPLFTEIRKETHLSHVLGFKLLLITPTPATQLKTFSYQLAEEGARVVLTGYAETADGLFSSTTTAVLSADSIMERYQWELETTIRCTTAEPVELSIIEFNNVYPTNTGRCMLHAPHKEYESTLLVDKDGVVWRFPHQHSMHYNPKIFDLHFAPGTLGGFFGDPAPRGCPVVEVQESTLEPLWGICDMYYDLHCLAWVREPVAPDTSWRFKYRIEYLDQLKADHLLVSSRPIPVTLEDWERHDYPRLELGMNAFTTAANIIRMDDACCFRPRPPQLVWDLATGHRAKGALRLRNSTAQETAWVAEPPTEIPAETTLNITAMVKTDSVVGKGVFVRVRYLTYVWHPTPHNEWPFTLESDPVNDTGGGWVKITVPPLAVPGEHFDYLVILEVVLDGTGVAWVTDVDINLQYAARNRPPRKKEGPGQSQNLPRPLRTGAAPLG